MDRPPCFCFSWPAMPACRPRTWCCIAAGGVLFCSTRPRPAWAPPWATLLAAWPGCSTCAGGGNSESTPPPGGGENLLPRPNGRVERRCQGLGQSVAAERPAADFEAEPAALRRLALPPTEKPAAWRPSGRPAAGTRRPPCLPALASWGPLSLALGGHRERARVGFAATACELGRPTAITLRQRPPPRGSGRRIQWPAGHSASGCDQEGGSALHIPGRGACLPCKGLKTRAPPPYLLMALLWGQLGSPVAAACAGTRLRGDELQGRWLQLPARAAPPRPAPDGWGPYVQACPSKGLCAGRRHPQRPSDSAAQRSRASPLPADARGPAQRPSLRWQGGCLPGRAQACSHLEALVQRAIWAGAEPPS